MGNSCIFNVLSYHKNQSKKSSEKLVHLCQIKERYIAEICNLRNKNSHHVCVVEKSNDILQIYEFFETYIVIFPPKIS